MLIKKMRHCTITAKCMHSKDTCEVSMNGSLRVANELNEGGNTAIDFARGLIWADLVEVSCNNI